jgi:nifR3 family TIM-barrel protein
MTQGFWKQLQKPIIVLAPMADVTDVAFRRLFSKYGKPDVTWTEFVSADGLVRAPHDNHDEQGFSSQDKLRKDLEYCEGERPIVAQLFSSRPEMMEQAAALVQELGFDGIDINMGCPDKNIEKQGCGAAMIKNPAVAAEIIAAAKRGAPNLPISVKTRIGFNNLDDFEPWVSHILKQDIACLTLHWRTRKEMSKVDAHWEYAARAVALRDAISPGTVLLGNGDVTTLEDAHEKVRTTGIDGVMVGRGIFGNPWFFNPHIVRDTDVTIPERLAVMVEHTKLFEELLPHKNFAVMKKHYKAYVDGFTGAKELRLSLMEATNSAEVAQLVEEFLTSNPHVVMEG